ncbi:hypothetical protein EDB85DRAFT_2151716 [Lactarius pseudohatsudake]|nr:hypothetical protein EDB85DRAFT_2151716 [Lactarius pseudohatsudake]
MDIDHLPPQQLSSDSTLSGWTLYPSPVFDYAGDSCVAPHHVNVHQHDYQQQYGHCQDAYYVTEAPQDSDLPPTDAPVSYWPAAQVPATGSLSTTLPDPLCYLPDQSYYGNHELHYHTAPVDQFQSIPSTAYATGYPDISPSTPVTAPSAVTAIPTFGPLPTIAPHQSESGHDLMPQDATTHSASYEGAITFQTTDTSYVQMGLYEGTYVMTTGESHTQYAPALAQERPQPQSYVATFTPAAQGQYVAPVSPPVPEAPPAPVPAPSPAPAARLKRKASSQSLGIRSRGRSPMGHLPYQEDIAKAGIKSRRSPDFSRRSSSRSSTPRPSSPVLQTLTFITYPDLEPKGHGRGGDCDGNGDDDDDDDGSPRRGRRGKKQPKKEPFLACFFCRGRKIACHPKNDGGEDRTCT